MTDVQVEHPRCPFCHLGVRPGVAEARRACEACMAWHHAECWAEHGRCSACGHSGDAAQTPPSPPNAAPRQPAPAPAQPPAPRSGWFPARGPAAPNPERYELVQTVAGTVRREHRATTRPQRLRCRRVERVAVDARALIFKFDVGPGVEFDWTWEGSTAYRPLELGDPAFETTPGGDLLWSGDVVEVDEVEGFLYLAIDDPNFDPTKATGTFFVRPFAFLDSLRRVYFADELELYRRLLPEPLRLTRAAAFPRLDPPPTGGLQSLARVWEHAWGVLWGPPGTGKTWTLGEQVAELLATSDERILVVSTTNKATDEAALSIGEALRRREVPITPRLTRVGRGADYYAFARRDMETVLQGSETAARRALAELRLELAAELEHEERARIQSQINDAVLAIKNASMLAAEDRLHRVVVTTAFNALALLVDKEMTKHFEAGQRLFTTVIIDEAGLLSRATTAALALLASRRALLVGDPRQLAPISKIARLLPPAKAAWLSMSALSHLGARERDLEGVRFLSTQRRMSREIGEALSAYQYEGQLQTAAEVDRRPPPETSFLAETPRAIWYVLDEDCPDLASVRAERGPGNRGWVRAHTREVLKRLFAAAPELEEGPGLFLSPFVAQARSLREYLAIEDHAGWQASTVHAQQGTETDHVIFDTVNAGSHVWSTDEWKRLVNVGLSRAREFVLLLASREEMAEPYLQELKASLQPRVLRWRGSRYVWEEVSAAVPSPVDATRRADPASLGAQIDARKLLRPVLSREQQRLCGHEMDGKPRLVRGVAGSGKTVILANWLARTLARLEEDPEARVWVVYANRALQRLLETVATEAWRELHEDQGFPWHKVELLHIRDVLAGLYERERLGRPDFQYDYEVGARRVHEVGAARPLEPTCDALFVDEAQDMGHDVLNLLTSLVRPSDAEDPKARSAIFFYDNAQNVYGRGTPTWSDFGLDMRGRSTVLKESFRSTLPLTEFALNVLYRLEPPGSDPDHKELARRGLIEETVRNDRSWWRVHYNQVDGPRPLFRRFTSLEREVEAVASRVEALIRDEAVSPGDIRLLYVGQNLPPLLQAALEPRLRRLDSRVVHATSRAFPDEADTLVITTPHSFKGYDAEVILVVGADQFASFSEQRVLANPLYVALTRARSLLEVYGQNAQRDELRERILQALEECADDLLAPDQVDPRALDLADVAEILDQIGAEHRAWLQRLRREHRLSREPIVSESEEILGQPVFWYRSAERSYACLRDGSSERLRESLEDAGIEVLAPGE